MNTYFLLSGTYYRDTDTFEGVISTVQAEKKPSGKWWYENKEADQEPKITRSLDYYSSRENAEKALAKRLQKAEEAALEKIARQSPKVINILPYLLKQKGC